MANWMKTLKEENERLKKELAEKGAQADVRKIPTPSEAFERPTQAVTSALSGRPATKPWNSKDGISRPYRRDYFMLKAKHPGWHPRFVSSENVESRLQRGYRIADPDAYGGGLTDNVVDEGASLGRHISRRGMILMEKPLEEVQAEESMAEERRKRARRSYKEQVKDQARSIEREMGDGYRVPVSDESREEQ